MNNSNELDEMIETARELLISGKNFGETIDFFKSKGYTQDEAWGVIVAMDKKYRLHPSTTVTD